MRSAKAKLLLVVWMLILSVGVAGVWFIHSVEQKKIMEYVDSQKNDAQDSINKLKLKINKFESTLTDMDTKVQGHSESLRAVQEALGANDKDQVKAQLEGLKNDLAKVQSDYAMQLDAMKKDLNSLAAKVSSCTSNVNLGQISVQKPVESKITVASPASQK
jgi:chromosome segregation ATPase